MELTAHSSKDYDAELLALRSRVLEAGGIVEYQIRYAVEALRTGDRTLVARVIADEDRVNRLEREIDEACTHIVARRAPAAGDLRLLIMMYKTITDLERIGDEAKKIALAARQVRLNERLVPGFPEIKIVSTVVIDMLRRALDGLARLESEGATAIARMDLEVDDHFKAIVRQLLTYMIEDPRTISPALDLVFVAKSLERIGDHAKNISEYVVYMIKGRDVRHLGIEEMEQVARA
ncbi:MAG TPA: phosphate signaling complex protein PhoU [Burkholderiales bacterium]|nr:phosphate signaling complex protein PhoU [Burkholderiales bacterium]